MDKDIKKITIELKESGLEINTEGINVYEIIGIIESYKDALLKMIADQKIKQPE